SGVVRKYCDGRLKTDIVVIDRREARQRLRKVRVVEFQYKEDAASRMGLSSQSRHRVGVIAQELRDVYSQSVHEDSSGVPTVDDERLIYEAIAVIQDLTEMQEDMEKKMDRGMSYVKGLIGKILHRKESSAQEHAYSISRTSSTTDLDLKRSSTYTLTSNFKERMTSLVQEQLDKQDELRPSEQPTYLCP
ncbi:hypothetical protein PMAYCL1PPCAC_15939, partial [Pristionchus mayeri]